MGYAALVRLIPRYALTLAASLRACYMSIRFRNTGGVLARAILPHYRAWGAGGPVSLCNRSLSPRQNVCERPFFSKVFEKMV